MIIASYVRRDQVAGIMIVIQVKSGAGMVMANRSIRINIESIEVGSTIEILNIKI